MGIGPNVSETPKTALELADGRLVVTEYANVDGIVNLAECPGAGTRCGGCHMTLRRLLAEAASSLRPLLTTVPPDMQGDPDILELLNELTAVNQYFADAKMCQNWGYIPLAAKFRDDSIDEMRDAEMLIDRILYL